MPRYPWTLEEKVFHEVSHMVVAWLLGADPVGVRIHAGDGPCDTEVKFPAMHPEQRGFIECLVKLAGEIGQWQFAGRAADLFRLTDWVEFQNCRKTAYLIQHWPSAEVARLALTPIIKDLLLKNDRLVYALANYLMQHRHAYGSDCQAILAQQSRLFGIAPSLLRGKDWRVNFERALDAQVTRLERAADEQKHLVDNVTKEVPQSAVSLKA